jgi:hypothetical protein
VRIALSFRIGSLFWRAKEFDAPEKNRLNGVEYYLSYDDPRPHSFRSDISRVAAGLWEDLPQRLLLSLPYLTIASSGPQTEWLQHSSDQHNPLGTQSLGTYTAVGIDAELRDWTFVCTVCAYISEWRTEFSRHAAFAPH